MSTCHPDIPMSKTRPRTMSSMRGMYAPLTGMTISLFPITSAIPTREAKILDPSRYVFSPAKYGPSARSSPGATNCFFSACTVNWSNSNWTSTSKTATYTLAKVFELLENLRLDRSLRDLSQSFNEGSVYACWHFHHCHKGSVSLPLFLGDRSVSFDCTVAFRSVFSEDLYCDTHLFHFDWNYRSELIDYILRLLLWWLEWVYGVFDLTQCL